MMEKQRDQRYYDSESGQITVLSAVIIMALIFLCLIFISFGAIASGKAQAQSAADFAALGAAHDYFYASVNDPCEKARTVAQHNRSELTACYVDGSTVYVQVKKQVFSPTQLFTVTAQARAGPSLPERATGP